MNTAPAHPVPRRALVAGLCALALATAPCAWADMAAPVVETTCEGQDWSLSEAYEEIEGSGFFTMGVTSPSPLVRHRGYTLTWAELNPAPGRYEWARIDEILTEAEREGHGVVLRLKASVTQRKSPWGDLEAVPQWVLDRSRAPTARTRDKGRRNWIEIVVPWNDRIQSAYLDFVEAFGQQRFLRHRRLLGLYVHGISTSFGEEFWLDEGAVAALRPLGLTPETLQTTFEQRLDAWARAAGPDVGRLAWVGVGWIAADEQWRAYRRVAEALDDRALSLGLGLRWGHSEAYNKKLDEAGQSVAEDGTLRVDATNPLVSGSRYWGGENEVWRDREGARFDYRRATLRALQMRMRILWVSDAGIALDPEISRYFTLAAGRTPAQSPDAWSVLRETEVRKGSKMQLVGNLDRFLTQRRDEPSDATKRSHPVRRAPQSKDWDEPVEWAARTVDSKAGGRQFRFDIDPAFSAAPALRDVRIQVIIMDGGASWHLELPATSVESGADGAVEKKGAKVAATVRSETVSGLGDGAERTITLRVPNLRILKDAPEFTIVADTGDLAISRVRVARANALPATGASCLAPPDRGQRDG